MGDIEKRKGESDVKMDNKIVEAIKKSVEKQMNEEGFADDLIYDGCKKAVNKVNFREIKESDVKNPIKTFLINWGLMKRVLAQPYIPNDWESQIANKIQKNCYRFKEFRALHLEDCDIERLKSEIEDCYETFKNLVRYTATAKILHLLCYNFFPLWDSKIRKKINDDFKRRTGKIDVSRDGYFHFMLANQIMLREYDKILSILSERYNKPKLRILDMFLFDITRSEGKVKWSKISFT